MMKKEGKIRHFCDLYAWQKSHELTLELYFRTKKFPKDELYGLTSQIRRASSSIGANIAEGFGRYHYKDKMRFYYQARGSVYEIQNFLFVVKDIQYLEQQICQSLYAKSIEIVKLLNTLIKTTTNQISNKERI